MSLTASQRSDDSLDDCETTLANLKSVCTPETRIIVTSYSQLWEPILALSEMLGQKMPSVEQNWLSTDDIMCLLELADLQPIKREWRTLVPRKAFGLGSLVNRYIAPFPLIRRLCLRNYVVARPLPSETERSASTTVLKREG